MKLIFALGNPGNNYNFTRHNFGFLTLDLYAKTHDDFSFKLNPKFKAEIYQDQINSALFAKPQTFYNNVGESLISILQFYKINPKTDLLVICDDFNLEFGNLRYREKGSNGGNNGLKSIENHLKTQDFSRLRLGTGNDPVRKQLGDTDFVLSKFTPAEREQLPVILKQNSDFIDKWLQG